MSSINEGVPTVLFEAMACGKPFVGTDVGGIPEIISDDRLGILMKPGDPAALAEAINKALDRDWDAEYILRYAEQFTWENIATRTTEVYKAALGGIHSDQ